MRQDDHDQPDRRSAASHNRRDPRRRQKGGGAWFGSRRCISDDRTLSILHSDGECRVRPEEPGVGKKERRERAQYFIDLVGLQGFENSYPNRLPVV